MKTEYEVRVLEIDKEELIEKLESLGAVKQGDYFYKRYVYEFNPPIYEKWIRLRTNGKKTTLTIKEIKSQEIDGTKELEIEVSDFEETNQILEKLGYQARNYQENKRTRYLLGGVELDIDTWPRIPTYLEIEGNSTEEVLKMMDLLEIQRDKATTKDVESVYREVYNIPIAEIDILKF